MKSKRNYLLFLNEMLDAARKGEFFIEEMLYDDFLHDEKTQFALIRALEIIGEASNKIPKSISEKYPDFPWREVRGMRNILIHEYFGVNLQVIWKTAKEDLPFLIDSLKRIIGSEDSQLKF